MNLQQKCVQIVETLDKKFDIKRDPHLSFTQLMEEVGELAQEINSEKLRNKKINYKNLQGEFADVIIQISILAKMLDVDIDEAVEKKIKVLEKRHNL